jgi:hypothetical protein
MALLIGTISVLLNKLTDRKLLAILTGITCALSIGTATLLYQLRNEFFSAYFFYVAALVAACIANSRIKNSTNTSFSGKQRLAAFTSYSVLAMMSLLAKVQVLPLFVLLSFGLGGWLCGCNLSGLKTLGKSICRAITLSTALAVVIKVVSNDMEIDFVAAISVLTLVATPIHIAVTAGTRNFNPHNNDEKFIAFSFGITSLGYATIARLNHWQHISWNPYSASKYTLPSASEYGLKEYLDNASRAYALLFERTFDGQLLAHVMALVVPLVFIVLLSSPRVMRSEALGQFHQNRLIVSCGAYLFICALAMSSIVSLRWPVDHYLPYQQPLLILAILAIGTTRRAWLAYKGIAAYMVVSTLLINLAYPRFAYATYVKNRLPVRVDVMSERAPSKASKGVLCDSQHAGKEWRGSIIGLSCRY